MRTTKLIAPVIALATCAASAQPPERGAGAPEAQLREQISTLQTETGHARPAELLDPLRALALLYEEDGDYALAAAALEEARYVARVHNGLSSAEEVLLLRQQVRNEKALGLHGRAWNLEQDMVTMARRNLDDLRMLPIFRDLAEDRLAVIDKVGMSERPPMIYAGCYTTVPLPPYDYTRHDARAMANSGGYTSPSCVGGINQDLIAKLRSEVLMYYADAIEIILRTGDYASEELRELEKAAIAIAGHRTMGSVRAASESSGTIAYCSRGTLAHYLALDILSSCLAPVNRGNRFVIANVGGRVGLIRLLSYEIRSGAPAPVRARALAELADWHVYAVPASRRRFASLELVNALYQGTYDELQHSGDAEASRQLFAPDLPVTLPTHEPNPFVSVATELPRYIDASFDVTQYGIAERIEIVAASGDATREHKRSLIRLIESTSFRPRIVDGQFGEPARVSVRYRLP
jgi:hypothetical protein